jgi:hypothetical protein
MAGARAVGIAGGPEKCAFVKNELRFDAAIDHRTRPFSGPFGWSLSGRQGSRYCHYSISSSACRSPSRTAYGLATAPTGCPPPYARFCRKPDAARLHQLRICRAAPRRIPARGWSGEHSSEAAASTEKWEQLHSLVAGLRHCLVSTPRILALSRILSLRFIFSILIFSEIQLGARLHFSWLVVGWECSANQPRLRCRSNGLTDGF